MPKRVDVKPDIVEFQPEYRDQVIELIDRNLKELGVIPNVEGLVDDTDLFKIPQIYSGKGRFWVALDGGVVVGTVAIRDLGDNKAKLNRMFVIKDLHGVGFGQRLLDKALVFAKKQGFREVRLNTHRVMKRAHRFYEKNGFQRIGEGEDKHFYRLEL